MKNDILKAPRACKCNLIYKRRMHGAKRVSRIIKILGYKESAEQDIGIFKAYPATGIRGKQ